MMRHYLNNPVEPVNDASYFECLDIVTENAKHLGDAMTGLATNVKQRDMQNFSRSVRQVGDAVCGLAEAASQAAYLVGVSEMSSVAGRRGLVDQRKFMDSVEAVRAACQTLKNPRTTQQQVRSNRVKMI